MQNHSVQNEKTWTAKKMLDFLERMQRSGAEFYLDGEEVSPGAALIKAVQEEGIYMADYVFGEAGKVEQVRFDRVEPE